MLISKIKVLLIFVIFFGVSLVAANANNDDEILKAMRDEMNRSMKNLKLESLQKPYYMEYTLRLRKSYQVGANLGEIINSDSSQFAQLSVGIRIGDYKFDNSNFFDVGLSFFGSSDDEEAFQNRRVQFEQDYNSLRRELWLASDAAYKQASEIFTKKESSLKSRLRRDTTPDFIQVAPTKNNFKKNYPAFDLANYSKMASDISSVFVNYPDIFKSSVGFEFIPETYYYVNSEGMEYIKTEYQTGFELVAYTQAKDGMPLADFFSSYSQDPANLPSLDSLKNSAKNVAESLSKKINTGFLEESYSGPVIFEGQAAAELWAQVFMPNLVAQRSQLSESGTQPAGRSQQFQSKIGGRVLPEFLSVKAIPNEKNYGKTQLFGTFDLDDTGIVPSDVDLVDKGYLRNLLSERVPTRRVKSSNGHKRGGAAMFSNMIVNADSDKSLKSEDLKNRMIQLCKDRELPYGIIVKRIANQNIIYTSLFRLSMGGFPVPRGDGAMSLVRAYKVYTDGHEELLRGAEIPSLAAQSFKDIINVGNVEFAYNYLAPSVISPFISGGDQYAGVSIITPDLLFEDIEVRSPEDDFRKPPILSNPLSIKK